MNGVAGRPSSSVKLLHDEVVYWSWYRHTFILFFENNTFFNMKLSPFPILYLQGCLAYSLSASSMQDFIIIIWVLKTWNSLNVGSAGNVYGRYVNESEFEPLHWGWAFGLELFLIPTWLFTNLKLIICCQIRVCVFWQLQLRASPSTRLSPSSIT